MVSVPLRGKEGAGQKLKWNGLSRIQNAVSVPLRGKEGAGHFLLESAFLGDDSFRPLAG